MSGDRTPFALADALTRQAESLAMGLEQGTAPLLDAVTPTTAELLRWWFGEDAAAGRALAFHAGQRQAILNVIVAHEVLDAPDLPALYRAACPSALLEPGRLDEVRRPKHAHPKYALKMATGTGKTWVLQALMIWQLLNRSADLEAGRDDPRFTRRFLVVAPGLIVYERLLDAFLGRQRADGQRDFATSDMARNAELFLPPAHRERVLQFVRSNACPKADLGLRATGNGLIGLTNWHLLSEAEEAIEAEGDEWVVEAPGARPDPERVVRAVLPLTPGKAAGNSLDTLDRRWARGQVLDYLADLPDLMVFNDEAHHIHELKKDGEATEVEWQKSLMRIAADKGRRFMQVDFSATPYNEQGGGRGKDARKVWFPHIVVDFDLKEAMRRGLVKSLVLDRRREIGALPLEFKVERDDDGTLRLAEGQRTMLRAGLAKLRKLETDFARIDPDRRPKMLVVCEDTGVTPLVAAFLRDEGLAEDDVLTVDSGKKAELGEKEWAPLRQRLFDVDRHAQPRVIVSVLMLREGFDVNNICVIVPLRASKAQILLEQTIGRGLRLMWREGEFNDLKRENRERINRGQEPSSLIDILSVVEHPAFASWYDDLMADGLAGSTGDDELGDSAGDLVSTPLREGFEAFDFALPFLIRQADESVDHGPIDPSGLPPFSGMTRDALKALLGKGDTFASQDLQSSTLYGDYRVHGGVMDVGGYNDWLSRITRRVAQLQSQPPPRGNRVAALAPFPYRQTDTTELAAALDEYVREVLFGPGFDPFEDEQWRLLLLQPVLDHVVKVTGLALAVNEERLPWGQTEVRHRRLSEVPTLMMRESSRRAVSKCIYTHQGWPARNGGLEETFIDWCQKDASIEAFCRIHETKHDFVRFRYLREDGLPAYYHPDFLARTAEAIYLVETKAQGQIAHPNVQRKLKAAANWCRQVNSLPSEQRNGFEWHYVLAGEGVVNDWKGKGARLADLLAFCRIREQSRTDQLRLEL